MSARHAGNMEYEPMTQPISLRDELAADQGKPTQCSVCRWLAQQDKETAPEWRTVLKDRSFTHASIHRAILRRDGIVSRGAIESHRSNNHS